MQSAAADALAIPSGTSSSPEQRRNLVGACLAHALHVWSVVITEAITALLITATLFLPLAPTLVVLPLLGIVLNGTSSVLYGTVPDLAPKGDVGRGFALFYTGVIGSGGIAPIVYGAIADHSNRTVGILPAALTAAAIIPLALSLKPLLEDESAVTP